MSPIQTRVFRRSGLLNSDMFDAAVAFITGEVNTFISTIDPNDMINIEYLVGPISKYGYENYYMVVVTYLT